MVWSRRAASWWGLFSTELVSPGLLRFALAEPEDRPVIGVQSFDLGPDLQGKSLRQGYNQVYEDRMPEAAERAADGYRLFALAVAFGAEGEWRTFPTETNAPLLRFKAGALAGAGRLRRPLRLRRRRSGQSGYLGATRRKPALRMRDHAPRRSGLPSLSRRYPDRLPESAVCGVAGGIPANTGGPYYPPRNVSCRRFLRAGG